MSAGPVLYRAAWVCPVSQSPIKNGCVLVVDDRIAVVETFSDSLDLPSGCRTIDLGNAAIVPGLVNAHTHLEFSQLQQPLGKPGIKFTDWVRLIVAKRTDANQEDPQRKQQSIVAGIQESFQTGVWAIGDIATDPVGENAYLAVEHKTPVHTTVFLEQLGRKQELLQQQRSQLDVHLLKNDLVPDSFACGASPHATYSVGWNLLDQICDAATQYKGPVAMHVAETLAERQLCDSLTGDFVGLLEDFRGLGSRVVCSASLYQSVLRTAVAGSAQLGRAWQLPEFERAGFGAAKQKHVSCLLPSHASVFSAHALPFAGNVEAADQRCGRYGFASLKSRFEFVC